MSSTARLAIIGAGVLVAGAVAFLLLRGGEDLPKPFDQPGEVPSVTGSRKLPSSEGGDSGSGISTVTSRPFEDSQGVVAGPTVSVEGRVLGLQDRSPVAGARIRVEAPHAIRRVTSTSETGSFLVEDLPASTLVRLEVEAEGFAPLVLDRLELPADDRLRLEDLLLKKGVAVSGRILDRHGRGIAKAEAQLLESTLSRSYMEIDLFRITEEAFGEDRALASVVADAEGRFTFPAVAPGSYVVRAIAPGHQSRFSAPFSVEPAATLTPVHLTLDPGRRLEGIVRDANGAPVEAAELAVMSEQEMTLLAFKTVKTKTDAHGRFTFTSLGPGALEIHVRSQRCAPLHQRIGAREKGPIEIRLESGARFSGRVYDSATGKGVPGAKIIVMSFDESTGMIQTGTDAAGNYAIENGPAGSNVHLIVQARGFAPVIDAPNPDEFNVLPGAISIPDVVPGANIHRDIAVSGGAAITGSVVDARTGKGISGAKVRVMNPTFFGLSGDVRQSATSAEDGSFTLAPLPAGRFLVIATHPEYVSDLASKVFNADPGLDRDWIELSPGQHVEGHRVELEHGRTLEGHVVNLEGRPVPGALVSWHSEPGRLEVFQSPLGGHQETCDAKGHFKLAGLPEDMITLRAWHPEYPGGGHVTADPRSPPPDGVKIRVDRGAILTGELHYDDGSPAEGVVLNFESSASNEGPMSPELWSQGFEATVDKDGRFRFEGLPPGEGRITVSWQTELEWEQQSDATRPGVQGGTGSGAWLLDSMGTAVELQVDRPTEVALRLMRPLSITGKIVNASGTPLQDCVVHAEPEGDTPDPDGSYWHTDPSGVFRLNNLRPGTYTISVNYVGTSFLGGESNDPPAKPPLAYESARHPGISAGTQGLVITLRPLGR